MKQISALGVVFVAALMMGCNSPQKTDNANFFTPEQDHVNLQAFCDRQAAAATHIDPSLYPYHFDGANLNSLGTAKLDSLLVSSEQPAATDIYLIGNSDTPEHRQAITKYMVCHGRKADLFTFVAGPNPHTYTMAARSVTAQEKLDGASASPDSGSGSMVAGTGGK